MKGKMGHGMEDYIVADTKTVEGHNLGLYAIFDGHSGRDVADYLQNHLFDNILSQVSKQESIFPLNLSQKKTLLLLVLVP